MKWFSCVPPPDTVESSPSDRRVCVVGSGTHFLSGITYYTFHLCNALSGAFTVSAVLMRQLLPTRLYPGRERVGAPLTALTLHPEVAAFNGVNWFWVPSLFKSLRFLQKQRPEVIIFQWWTGTVLHTYLALALVGKMLGATLIIEFHEVLDTGELRLPLAGAYARVLGKLLIDMADGFVAHSEYDRGQLVERYAVTPDRVTVIGHGPYEQYRSENREQINEDRCNLLFFGTIRPFKGLEDLIQAFESMPEEIADRYHLTVVGETWEGWTVPADMIGASRYRDRITFVNYYVPDELVAHYFSGADIVVLPYHRSSASGPLHVAMSHGLPVVTTGVGGLTEAAAHYEGVFFVPPRDSDALRQAILEAAAMKGRRFRDPHSWERTVSCYEQLFTRLRREKLPRFGEVSSTVPHEDEVA